MTAKSTMGYGYSYTPSISHTSSSGSYYTGSGSTSSYNSMLLGATSATSDEANLYLNFGRTMIALGGLTVILAAVQAWRTKRYVFNGIIFAAAACYLIQGAINASLDQISDIVSGALAASAFEGFFAPIAWLLIFETFRIVTPIPDGKRFHTNMIGNYFGYFWSFVIIICTIGAYGALGSMVQDYANGDFGDLISMANGLLNIFQTIQFVAYGLWVYLVFAGAQFYSSHTYLHSFKISFAAFAFLLVLVNIGRSVGTGASGSPGEITDFVLARVGGIIALWVALWYGEHWVKSEEVHEHSKEYE